MQFRYINQLGLFWIKTLPDLVHVWIDVIVIEDRFIQSLWTIKKDRLVSNKDKVRTFHHISCPVICKIQVTDFNPVGVVVIDSLVKTNESFLLKVLAPNDSVVLAFEIKNLWIAEVIGRISRLVNQDLINFFNLSILIHQRSDLVGMANPFCITNISSIE